jgi:hypothetical protein
MTFSYLAVILSKYPFTVNNFQKLFDERAVLNDSNISLLESISEIFAATYPTGLKSGHG